MNELIRKCISTGHAVGWYILKTVDEIGDLRTGLENAIIENVRECV